MERSVITAHNSHKIQSEWRVWKMRIVGVLSQCLLCEWHLCGNIFALRIWRNKEYNVHLTKCTIYILKRRFIVFAQLLWELLMQNKFHCQNVNDQQWKWSSYLLLINFEVNFVQRDSIVCWPTHLWLVPSLTLIWTNFWKTMEERGCFYWPGTHSPQKIHSLSSSLPSSSSWPPWSTTSWSSSSSSMPEAGHEDCQF